MPERAGNDRWLASLPMYDLAPVRALTDAWWSGLARCFEDQGLPDVPHRLSRQPARETQWRLPRLLFSQTCGFPFSNEFNADLCLLLTPCYRAPGCRGPYYRSLIVVGDDEDARTLDELEGATFAVNSLDSWSGWHTLLRELGQRGHDPTAFIGDVCTTGMHLASIRTVANRQARAAAIDCVTHGLLAAHDPQALAGTRVLDRTDEAPGLPYVTSARTSNETVYRLREGLRGALRSASLAGAREALGIVGFEALTSADYAFMSMREH